MKEVFGLLLSFLPWILFAVVTGLARVRLEVALLISLATVPVIGLKELRQGFLLTWGTLFFFGLALILVSLLKNLWVPRHMDVLARAALAVITWVSILAGKPFTLQYARQNVPQEYWQTPSFIRTCYLIAMVWGVAFSLATAASLARPYLEQVGSGLYHLLSLGIMLLAILFTQWYTKKVRRTREV